MSNFGASYRSDFACPICGLGAGRSKYMYVASLHGKNHMACESCAFKSTESERERRYIERKQRGTNPLTWLKRLTGCLG